MSKIPGGGRGLGPPMDPVRGSSGVPVLEARGPGNPVFRGFISIPKNIF